MGHTRPVSIESKRNGNGPPTVSLKGLMAVSIESKRNGNTRLRLLQQFQTHRFQSNLRGMETVPLQNLVHTYSSVSIESKRNGNKEEAGLSGFSRRVSIESKRNGNNEYFQELYDSVSSFNRI